MLWHLPKGSLFLSYRIDKLVKERPYGDPLHRCSLTLTAVPLCPAGEALVTLAKQTSCKPLADPALRALLQKILKNLASDMLQYLSCCDILKAETDRRHTLCEANRLLLAHIR